jgi:hypothetical protein
MRSFGWFVGSTCYTVASFRMFNDTTFARRMGLPGHPFDLTKTRLQTAPPGTYAGGSDVVKKTLARDGPAGLYRGVVPPLLGVTPIFALSFWVHIPQASRVICEI